MSRQFPELVVVSQALGLDGKRTHRMALSLSQRQCNATLSRRSARTACVHGDLEALSPWIIRHIGTHCEGTLLVCEQARRGWGCPDAARGSWF